MKKYILSKLSRRIKILLKLKSPESKLAHKYLDGLTGIEVGGSAHNPFGLNVQNVDYTDSIETIFKIEESRFHGKVLNVDIVANGDSIPLKDNSQDFVVSSHVLEHFPDPIKALKEWYRVIRSGGYIFVIVPHKERTFDSSRNRTTLAELIIRHKNGFSSSENGHFSVWLTEDLVEIFQYLNWKIVEAHDVDDKVGNGFMIVVQKTKNEYIDNKVLIKKYSKFMIFINKTVILYKKLLSIFR